MRDVPVKLPAKGEKKVIDEAGGEAFRVDRMDFLGYEDQLGNPRIFDQSGRIDIQAEVGPPVQESFDRLMVESKSADQAGTVMIVRVYEEEENAVQKRNRRSLVSRAPSNLEYVDIQNSVTTDETASDYLEVMDFNYEYARYIAGLTLKITDAGLKTGFPASVFLTVTSDNNAGVTRSKQFTVSVGIDERFTFVDGLLIPKGCSVNARVSTGDPPAEGKGQWEVFLDGYAYFDKNSEVPPF